MHPPSNLGGVKNFRKVFAEGVWVKSFYFGEVVLLGGNFVGEGGHRILKENLKLHNPNIKSIFTITSLIYFRCTRNPH